MEYLFSGKKDMHNQSTADSFLSFIILMLICSDCPARPFFRNTNLKVKYSRLFAFDVLLHDPPKVRTKEIAVSCICNLPTSYLTNFLPPFLFNCWSFFRNTNLKEKYSRMFAFDVLLHDPPKVRTKEIAVSCIGNLQVTSRISYLPFYLIVYLFYLHADNSSLSLSFFFVSHVTAIRSNSTNSLLLIFSPLIPSTSHHLLHVMTVDLIHCVLFDIFKSTYFS
jgi:hypothetical protein